MSSNQIINQAISVRGCRVSSVENDEAEMVDAAGGSASEISSDFSAPSPMTSGVMNKRTLITLQQKITLLLLIKERKSILFGHFSTSIENKTKVDAWKEVADKAKSIGACTQTRKWDWVRDSLYGVWKSRALAKRDNSRKTGSAGGKHRIPDDADKIIYEIIGEDSPAIEGLQIPESGEILSLPDNFVDQTTDGESSPKVSKKRKLDYNDVMAEKRNLQVEFLRAEVYRSKLKSLKLERELGLGSSEFTREFEEKEIVFLETIDF